ncbi:MAG TPA: hypothetical protein VMT18_00880 [Planctomycetota bacterium]|nr:hypothetical protein [Planctomycetota bacterium]
MAPKLSRAFSALALCALLTACSSIQVERTTKTSGNFRSRAWAFTLLSWDMPQTALGRARENAADTRLVNMQVSRVRVTPDWGWWNWLFDILSVRVATIEGTWGFTGEESAGAVASPGSTTGSSSSRAASR